MDIVKGQIVRSIAGHDKNDFFVVMDIDDVYALICDGKHRPVQRQKRKKLKHLSITKTIVDIDKVQTNREIRRAIRLFRENQNPVS